MSEAMLAHVLLHGLTIGDQMATELDIDLDTYVNIT